MDSTILERHFLRMGARARVVPERRPVREHLTLDVRGDVFEIGIPAAARFEPEVLDVRPRDRHLLLMSRDDDGTKHRFLCGHDERHWFVAAIPEKAGSVTDVGRAMEALKPPAVRDAQDRAKLRSRDRMLRRNAAYVRQGEWFFLPEPELEVEPIYILRKEPLSRGRGSKPHVAEECYRTGGVPVYVCHLHRTGVDEDTHRLLLREQPERYRTVRWTCRLRDPAVYVRGRIRHADHKTIRLACWHRVRMNTENKAEAMRHVVFLD